MRLVFKQRFFSWFDSYDIYDDNGATVFTVEGKLAWGHCLHILNAAGEHIGTVQQRVLTFLPKFDLYEFDRCIGTIKKEFTFFVPHFTVEGSDWAVEGQFMEWDYTIVSASRKSTHTAPTYPMSVSARAIRGLRPICLSMKKFCTPFASPACLMLRAFSRIVS